MCTCAGLYYKMNGQNRPLIKPKRRLVRGIWNYNDDDDADGDGDEDDDNEDDADGEGDSEGVGDILYATHLSGQCLGPRPFFGRLQFIKLDHLPRHFGPHPTYISLLVTALCNTNNNRSRMKNLIQGSEFWAVQTELYYENVSKFKCEFPVVCPPWRHIMRKLQDNNNHIVEKVKLTIIVKIAIKTIIVIITIANIVVIIISISLPPSLLSSSTSLTLSNWLQKPEWRASLQCLWSLLQIA